jgi:Fe2+ transport system protein FeoA
MFGRKRKVKRAVGYRRIPMTLADAMPGRKYRILQVNGGHKLNSRLYAMGLMPDEEFMIYSSSRGGPAIIVVKGSRFALGRCMTGKIIIEEV